MILQDAMRKDLKDAELHREYEILTAKTPIRSCQRDGESDQRNAARRRSDRAARKNVPTRARFPRPKCKGDPLSQCKT